MGLWSTYFTDTITHKRCLDVNHLGQTTYAPPTKIAARVDIDRREVTGREGRQLFCDLLVLTTTRVDPGDILVIEDIEHVAEWSFAAKDLQGRVDHWEVRA